MEGAIELNEREGVVEACATGTSGDPIWLELADAEGVEEEAIEGDRLLRAAGDSIAGAALRVPFPSLFMIPATFCSAAPAAMPSP